MLETDSCRCVDDLLETDTCLRHRQRHLYVQKCSSERHPMQGECSGAVAIVLAANLYCAHDREKHARPRDMHELRVFRTPRCCETDVLSSTSMRFEAVRQRWLCRRLSRRTTNSVSIVIDFPSLLLLWTIMVMMSSSSHSSWNLGLRVDHYSRANLKPVDCLSTRLIANRVTPVPFLAGSGGPSTTSRTAGRTCVQLALVSRQLLTRQRLVTRHHCPLSASLELILTVHPSEAPPQTRTYQITFEVYQQPACWEKRTLQLRKASVQPQTRAHDIRNT